MEGGDMNTGGSRWAVNCLLVCNLHPNIPNVEKVLREYFEDAELSGGGPICAKGITKTQSEREALVEFVHRQDADRVKTRKNHAVVVNGERFQLEVIKCPMTIYLKYNKEHKAQSPSGDISESFVVIDGSEQTQRMSDNENPDTNRIDLTIDNQPPLSSRSPETSPRDASSSVGQTVPEAYQSPEVIRLQKEKEDRFRSLQYYEEKIKEAMEKERLRQSFIQEEQNSLSEKAIFESTEKEKVLKSGLKANADIKGRKEDPRSASIPHDSHLNPPVQQDMQSGGQSDQEVTSRGEPSHQREPADHFDQRAIGHPNYDSKPTGQPNWSSMGEPSHQRDTSGHSDHTAMGQPSHDGKATGQSGMGQPSHQMHATGQLDQWPTAMGEARNGQKRVVLQKMPAENEPLVKRVHNSDVDYGQLYSAGHHRKEDAMEEYETSSRTVVVEGITERVDVEMVELFFESRKKSGGGSLEKLDMQEKSGRAILVFEDKEHADAVLSKKQFTIGGCEVTVRPYTDLTTRASKSYTDGQNTSTASEEDIVIRVSGITSDMSEEMLQLFFEHQRKSGGGEIKEMEVDFRKGEALVSYVDREVAECVLSRKTFEFLKAQLSVSKLEKPKWNKKTVLVTGFGTMTEELLELLYENKKKTGGGPVKSVTMIDRNNAALVTFTNEADAERVLHQGFVKRTDGSVISACKPTEMSTEAGASGGSGGGATSTKPEPTQSVLSNSIMVLGIDENITDDVLEMLFENESKSGGGPVEKITIDPEFGMAIVTFLKVKVAQRVLAKRSIEFQNLNLVLQPHVPEAGPSPQGAEGGADIPEEMDQSGHTPVEEPASTSKMGRFNCIEVSGLPRDTKEEYVRLFFESGRHTGGGEIESVTTNSENGTAVIVFKEESTTKKVLQRHNESPLVIEGFKLQIKAIDTSLYGGMIPTNTSCAIQVTGLPVNASDESVLMFFENRRMSGGDSLQDIVHYSVEGRAVLTYATPEVAQRVIDKHQAKPIHFEGSLLQIQMLYSNSRPAQIVGPKEANVLFLQNVNEEAGPDDIRFYLERVPKCKVSECVFGLKQGTVLVYFVFMPGFEKFYELSCQKPLRGSMVDIECVARSKSIEVYGVDKLSGQKLQMYFEHPKSKGGDVDSVDILTEEKCAIVTFVKYGVAESVLSQQDHTLERCKLIIKLHHECIGILPPHHDHTSPGAGIPSHCAVDKCDPDILAFILSRPSNRKHIEDGIAAVCGRVKWPDQITENVQVQIECTLQRNMPGLTSKVKTWSADVEGMFVSIMSDFTRDEINVLQGGWKEFLKITGELKPQTPDDLEVTVNQDACTVVAVGKRNTVEQYMDSLRQASANVEEKLQRQAQIIPETVNNLKAYQIKFLLAHKFPQNTKQTFQDMKIEADLKQKKVVFTGVPTDIITAKLQMYELVNQMKYDKLTFSRPICGLLKQKKTREYLVNEFQVRKAIVVWDVSDRQDGEVLVYARTDEELTSGVATIKSCIVEHILDVADENKPCLRQPSWSQLKDTMLKDNEGELRISVAEDTSSITVAANHQIINGVLEQIKTYMIENTVLEKFANMERGTALLLQRERSPDLRKIEEDFKDFSVKLCPSGINSKPGYIIEGTKDGLSRALTRITALAGTIIACDHKINKPGMPQYFLDDRGRGLVTSLESRYRVAIIIGDEEEQAAESEPTPHKATAKKPVIKATATLGRDKKVLIVQGDITAYCVDAIVNAANEDMAHIGGVAKAIVDKGGMVIQQECSKVVAIEGRLLPGKVYTSQAGKLPCRKVIHTVGPKWQGGYKNEENELYESVFACLEEAADVHGFKRIALPAISSGVFGFPKDKCCEIILTVVRDYFREVSSSSLKEIHLIDNNRSLVSSLHKAARDVLGEDKVKAAGSEQDTQTFPVGHFQAVHEATGQADGGADSSGPIYWTKVGNGVLQSQQGLQVHIVKGSIITQQVDVIVNTTNKELNLGSGGVSSMILKAAGAALQTECQQNAPGGVNSGDVVQTSGGNMSCKKIYHGACSQYNGSKSLQVLRQFLTKCLTCAHASGMSTIAIPAIGTGNLNYPRPEVAQAMYEEVKTFSENHVGTSLQNIYFVLYDKDGPTLQAFEAEADRLQKSGSTGRRSTHRQMVRERASSPETTLSRGYGSQRMPNYGDDYGQSQRMPTSGEGYGQRGRSHQRSSQRSSSGIQSGEMSQLHMEHLKVIVVKGDITKETTDAIVNTTGDDLNFGSQVSRAILKAGGRLVAQECAEIGQVDKNHIAVTAAGNLKCQYIIHVGAPDDPQGFRYQKKWQTRIREILKAAIEYECRSVSFPALGTGTLSVSADKMASTIFEAFHEFSKKNTCLKEIRVVVFEDRMIQTFQKELENMTKKGKGIFEVLTEKLGNMMSMVGWDSPVVEGDEHVGPSSSYNPAPVHHRQSQMIHLDESILQFHIYGFSRESIDQVTEQIEKTCKDETQDKVLDSKDDQEVISRLTDKQTRKILSFEKSHHVKITIDKGKRVSRLRIQGQHSNVLQVMDKVYRIFRETEQLERDKSEAELLSKQVQWQYLEQGKYQAYPPDMNAVIEKAYLEKKPFAEFIERDPAGGIRSVRVNFGSMKETQKGAVGGVASEVDVRRYTGESVDLPNTWSPMKVEDHFLVVDIQAGTPEYTTVEQSFQNGFTQGGTPFGKTILKIQRVQNPSMYKKYMVHKVHLDASNPANTVNERTLWHGTTDDTLAEIHTNGFNRSFCGKNGTAFGRGVYFATYATLSDGYARPNAAGQRHMYQCKVLAGEFTRGNPNLLVPPAKDPNKATIKYDSVVDNATTPKIFVVFQDSQAYPEYLITYQ